ncbi:MAG: hypothetical protein HYU41_00600 [Candidatus Rokubacteria bacterium]|nr:hypothetical protein [Candidatus Rokubacteria bacterium]
MPTTAVDIPILDLGPYLAGGRDTARRAAAALRHALEEVGFYYVVNHPIPPALVARIFAETARFHALPLDDKLALRMNRHNIGYLPVGGSVSRASAIDTVKKPNVVEALFLKRDRPPDHPDVAAGVLFRGRNQWPAHLPGFRETCLEYFQAMEAFGRRLMPLYALALDLPDDYYFFDPNTHWPIACLPTCQGPDHPPRYEPTTYERYLAWFTDGNYRAETSARP